MLPHGCSELIIPRVIDVPQTAVVMDACDYFALLISCQLLLRLRFPCMGAGIAKKFRIPY